MHRLNVAFVVVVLVAAAVGGATAVQFRNDLDAVSTVITVEDRVEMRVTDTTLTETGLTVTARLRNPTGYDFRVTAGLVTSHDGSGDRIVSGAGTRVDDSGDELAAKGTLTVRLSTRASPSQRRRLAEAFENGAMSVTVTVPLYYDDTRFTVTETGTVAGGDR